MRLVSRVGSDKFEFDAYFYRHILLSIDEP